jgi:hypothetical protein
MTLALCPLPADFSYRETSTITGVLMASLMKVAGVFSKQALVADEILNRSHQHGATV